MEGGDTLTIRQAATLLNCHPNTVRNRIKSGAYKAEKVITERGETYMIPRSELSDSTTNRLPSASQSQSLPDVREGIRAVLEPFVRELGDVREELGRERERREQAERRAEDLERELREARDALEASESPGPTDTPTPDPGDAHRGTGGQDPAPEQAAPSGPPRSWWRRMFGG
jgi:excisionase family DNA binding protein